jgi:hypothetical protein
MGKPEVWDEPYLDDVVREKSGTSHDRRWIRRAVIGVVGAVYLAALYFDIGVDGGREAALFFGTTGFAITFPILLLVGKLMGAVVGKRRNLGADARTAVIVAPAILSAGLLAYEGYRSQDPVVKFQRFVASPAPPGLRIITAYTYKGINFRVWAFHFTIAPGNLQKILARRPYRHEVDPAGFDLRQVHDNGRGRPGYPVPPPDFKAVHRCSSHEPIGRLGYDVTLYGDASLTEFYTYGYVE